MEYIFGRLILAGSEVECVKTVGEEHSDLSGFCHIERHYSDNIITDDFKITEKYKSLESDELCFDWYLIENHSRYVDRFTPARATIEADIADAQDALCTLSEDMEERLTALEEAVRGE